MRQISINCDMGESFGRFHVANESQIMPLIDACNIACGFHAGDPSTIEETILLALKHNVVIGAHPSYPDLQGFGRRYMDILPKELEQIIRYQIAALVGVTKALGGSVQHVKPHGALYNRACTDEATAVAVVEAVKSIDDHFCIFAPFASVLATTAEKHGLDVTYEVFIDRQYHNDLQLVSRREEGAVISEPSKAIEQVMNIARENRVKSKEGSFIHIIADTYCIHGDNPGAIAILEALDASFKSS